MASERKKLLQQRDILISQLREQRQDVRQYENQLTERLNQSWIILLAILLPPFLVGWHLRSGKKSEKSRKNLLQPILNLGVATLISQAKERILAATRNAD